MQELWKDVVGYEGYYQVSNLGRVKQLCVHTNLCGKSYTRKERIKKQSIRNGYLCVGLTKDGKHRTFLVHRLVADAFVENSKPDVYDCVNHKDENKQNNCVDNLEWCDRNYNDNYGTRNQRLSKLSADWSAKHLQELRDRSKQAWLDGRNSGFAGHKHSDATKQKISDSLKEGYKSGRLSPSMLGVHRYGKDAPRYGAVLSDETKRKISESVSGFKHTAEAKEKMSKNIKNRVFMNNGIQNKRVRPEDVNIYLSNGYVFGRLTPWQSNNKNCKT